MQRQIIYIINPIAGTRKKKDLQDQVERLTGNEGIPYLVFPSVASGDYSFLHPVINENKTTDIVIAGGDGTVSQVISSLKAFDVNFGVIPCGSGNGLSNAAKIPKNTAKALKLIFTGKAKLTDAFYINGRFSCMLCGLGFDARVAHDFAAQPKRGLATYAKLAARNFFSMRQYPFTIRLNDATFETAAYFISIANSNQFGNNFTIAPKASLSDGLLDVVIVTSKNKFSFLVQTLKQLAGRNRLKPVSALKESRGVIYFQTGNLQIINPDMAPLHIDGDPAETDPEIKITVLEKCFRLIQGV